MNTKFNRKRLWWLSYYAFYLIAFFSIEAIPVSDRFHLLSSPLDDLIPFCEFFIIPYFIWFIYFPGVWIYKIIFDEKSFTRFTIYLFSGMTLFIIISLIYPNYLELRVDFDKDRNVFARLCGYLQSIDTPTNVFPSIHVFNSIVAHIGIIKSETLKDKRWIRVISFIIMCSICIATLFLKQHSFVDFAGGIGLAIILYIPIYMFKRQ